MSRTPSQAECPKRLVVTRNDARGPGVHTRSMDAPLFSSRLVVEVEADADPIRGTVTDEQGNASAFVGWVALISALEERRGTPSLVP